MTPQSLDYCRPLQRERTVRIVTVSFLRKWWPLLVLLSALILFGLWEAVGRHVDEARPGTAAEVLVFTSVPPPTQASRIWVASYCEGGGWGFSHYVRFEAPPAVCEKYALAVTKGVPLSNADHFNASLDTNIFNSIKWFDLDKAITLLHARGCVPRPNIHVWVDTTRGVFYFMETD